MPMHCFRCLSAIVLVCLIALGVSAKEEQRQDAQGRDYWLYTPDEIDPDKTYTLVLGVHGYRGTGKGAGGMAGWASQRDVIVLGPTYDSNGYQYLQAGSDEQTLELIKAMHKEFKLNKKIFVSGFSGGAQFAHRFAMKYPELVAGCAAHSGGTWATGDYAERAVPNPKARGVLFVISCGEKDTGKSFGEAPFGRLEWAKKYEKLLEEGGFLYDAQWWPGVGHSPSKGSRQMTEDCFEASMKLLPKLVAENEQIDTLMRRKDYAGAWALIKAQLDQAKLNSEGILGRVYALQAEQTEAPAKRIDQWAQRQVERAVRQQEDAAARRAALEELKARFEGAAKTTQAIEAALAELE